MTKIRKRTPEAERFWPKVDKNGPLLRPMKSRCWEWTASRYKNGYGQFTKSGGQNVRAHRWSYEQEHGHIPAGLEIDHLCRNRACVRPSHLEAVTRTANLKRSPVIGWPNRMKPLCAHGHEYDYKIEGGPRKGHRICVTCARERQRRYRARKAAA